MTISPSSITRRAALRTLAGAGAALALPWPALAQGETVVPFTDLPAPGPNARRPPSLDTFFTPNDEFFAVQHYGQPTVDAAAFRLRVDGLVRTPVSLDVADLQRRPRLEQVVGFECSGNNNARGNPLVGNARWTGTSLAALLEEAGLAPNAREVVFFGADTGEEEVAHGGAPATVTQHFGRGLSVADAMRPEVMLAWAMNGEPLPAAHGAPVRLVVPGWYGVANVKWLERIHVQDARFMGRFMARDYVTLREAGAEGGGPAIWNESSVSRIRLKSAIGRVTQSGSACTIVGFALTDGTPLQRVEVRIDDGPWQPATLSPENTPYSWQLFSYRWANPTPGEHTVVSRAVDAQGTVQPEQDDPTKTTRWENNGQFLRRFAL